MKNRFRSLLLIFGLIALSNLSPNAVLCSAAIAIPFSVKSVTSDDDLTKAFRHDPKWRGADGACTVPLNDSTTVWLFGDTFIRKAGLKKNQLEKEASKTDSSKNDSRKENSQKDDAKSFAFINNSAAVQKVRSNSLKFFWKTENDSPQAIMAPTRLQGTAQPKSWYWPGDGFVLEQKLFIVNKLVFPEEKTEEKMFGFDWRSDDLLSVSNPSTPPSSWKWQVVALPEKSKEVLLGTACLVKTDYVYFYSSLPRLAKGWHVHPTGVSRISKVALTSMDMSKFSFWNGKEWSNDSSQSAVVFEDGAPEMTVTELQGEPYLVATYMPPLSSDISMRFSKSPEGPWSAPLKVFHCPEGQVKVLDHNNSVYSAKAHPELSRNKDEVIVSYCSNPGEMKHYLSRPDLYYPRLIRVSLQPAKL
jgi:hypothetical protein